MSIVLINNAAERSEIVLFSANILRQQLQESKNQQAEIVAKINAFCVVPIHLETGWWWWEWWDLDQLFPRCSDSSWLLLFGSWCCDNQTVNYVVMMIFIENMTKQFRCWCWWWRGMPILWFQLSVVWCNRHGDNKWILLLITFSWIVQQNIERVMMK